MYFRHIALRNDNNIGRKYYGRLNERENRIFSKYTISNYDQENCCDFEANLIFVNKHVTDKRILN